MFARMVLWWVLATSVGRSALPLAFSLSSSPSPRRCHRRVSWQQSTTIMVSSTTLLFDSSVIQTEREILQPLILVDEDSGELLAYGHELQPLPDECDTPDQDELEMLYPTQKQYFQLSSDDNSSSSTPPVQVVRTTSFGCGKLGHQVWPSALALSLALIHEYGSSSSSISNTNHVDKPKSILELGAGCGLPSIVCRDVLQIPVTATDFWYDGTKERDWDRLIPDVYHGINLNYNVARGDKAARVQPLDWHDIETVRMLGPVDLVVGSDIIYYPMDVEPLWNTMETLLRDCGATKVILMAPLKPDIREAMPAFLQLLENKSSQDVSSDFVLERQGLYLYKSWDSFEAREGGAHFLKLSLSLRR